MALAVVGVEHGACPVVIREPMVLEDDRQLAALDRLREHTAIGEAVVVSTCARTELYLAAGDDPADAVAAARSLLLTWNPRAAPFVVSRRGEAAVRHAFRVTAGLESQIVGEDEVTGQVRAAVRTARERGALGPELSALFQAAVACSRRIRREGGLARMGANVSSATAAMAATMRDITSSSVLIIGSGKVARLLATELVGSANLVLAARNPESLGTLASTTGARSVSLDDALTSLHQFDIVCCATRSSRALIGPGDLDGVRDMLIFDLSIPRNVDPAAVPVGSTLFDVDAVSPAGRTIDRPQLVESIVAAEVHHFLSRTTIRQVAPIIAGLREHVERVRDVELAEARSRLAGLGDAEREAVEDAIQRMIDRMFHHLVVRLKLAALTDPNLVRAAEFLLAHGEDRIFPTKPVTDPAIGDRSEADLPV